MQLEQDIMTSSFDFSTTIPSAYDSPSLGWVKDIWLGLIDFSLSFLTHLDPSHFQNVFLGAFALIIPFTLAHLNATNNPQIGDFRKLVMLDYYDSTKHIFWVVLSGLIVFALFDGHSVVWKFVAVVIFICYCGWIYTPLAKLMTVFNINYHQEELNFLELLTFKKDEKTEAISEKMRRSWASIWSEGNIVEEQKFTEIFISHLNQAETSNQNEDIGHLLEIYLRNINNRNMTFIIDQIIPRVLDMHYANYSRGRGEVPLEESMYFWMNMNLCEKILQSTISLALKSNMRNQINPPWESVASHITKIELLYQQSNQDDRLSEYIRFIVLDFCIIFFNEIGNSPSAYALRDSDFPEEWRLTSANYKKIVPQFLCTEFTDWARERVFKIVQSDNYDKNLTEIIYILFPSIDYTFFPIFLMIYYDNNIASVFEKYRNFRVLHFPKEFISQERRKETAAVILKYFAWPQQSLTSESEMLNFNKGSEEERAEYIRQHLKTKITEAESDAIKKLCQNDQRKEGFREEIIDFYNFMITELENNPDLL